MFSDAPVVVAMVSGGADSVALLMLLARGELGDLGGLSALHINHRLRGAASDGDEAFVRGLCDRLGISCAAVSYDVEAYATRSGFNVEDAGRRVRYRFAEEEIDARCHEAGVSPECGRIAVAHTADDRLETFLARLVTGAGATGLSSIQPVRGRVVRPLLDVRREAIVHYLESLGQGWREDATNADVTRERAWVRHSLLPLIEGRNPSFAAVAERTMGVLAGDDSLLQEMADAFAGDFSRIEGHSLVFNRAALRTLSRPMIRRTIRTVIVRTFPEASRIEFDHIEALVDGIARDGFSRDLPFGLRAENEYDILRVSRKDSADPVLAPGLLHCPGSLDLGDAGTIDVLANPDGTISMGPDRVSIDAERVSWPLVVDGPREGDVLHPMGMVGTKKLSDLFIDAKVPQRLRRFTPVVRDGDRIVWVAGVRLAEECRVAPESRRVVDIVWHRGVSGTDRLTG